MKALKINYMNNIMLLGGSGHLGSNILSNLDCIAPTRKQLDITCLPELRLKVPKNIKTIIHSAGYIDTKGCEDNPQRCLDINVGGTQNIVSFCRTRNIKLVYISSEYVFDYDGKISESTPMNPKNVYGVSKACSELIVGTLSNHLIIRAPFIRTKTFEYDNAFDDQFTVRQYVDKAASDIVKCIKQDKTGIQHIVGKYQSVYDLAKETNPNVGRIKTPDGLKKILPMKTNLIKE